MGKPIKALEILKQGAIIKLLGAHLININVYISNTFVSELT